MKVSLIEKKYIFICVVLFFNIQTAFSKGIKSPLEFYLTLVFPESDCKLPMSTTCVCSHRNIFPFSSSFSCHELSHCVALFPKYGISMPSLV